MLSLARVSSLKSRGWRRVETHADFKERLGRAGMGAEARTKRDGSSQRQ